MIDNITLDCVIDTLNILMINSNNSTFKDVIKCAIKQCEKGISKNPIDNGMWQDSACPNCGANINYGYSQIYGECLKDHCSECGQRININQGNWPKYDKI